MVGLVYKKNNIKKVVSINLLESYVHEGWVICENSKYFHVEYTSEEKTQHYKKAASNRPHHTCPICGRNIAHPVFSKHLKACANKDVIDWDKVFAKQQVLMTRDEKSIWVKPHKVKSLISKGWVLGGKKSHKKLKEYICHICGKVVKGPGGHTRHMTTFHGWTNKECQDYRKL